MPHYIARADCDLVQCQFDHGRGIVRCISDVVVGKDGAEVVRHRASSG